MHISFYVACFLCFFSPLHKLHMYLKQSLHLLSYKWIKSICMPKYMTFILFFLFFFLFLLFLLNFYIFLYSSLHFLFFKILYDIINEIMQKCMFIFKY